jgi:hypothetical protein
MASILALKDPNSTTTLVQDIERLLDLSDIKNISFVFQWIRGDENCVGNELADRLAKEGATCHSTIVYDCIPVSYVNKQIYNKTIVLWNQKWLQTIKGSETNKYFSQISDRLKVKKHFVTNFYLTQFVTNDAKLWQIREVFQ